MEQGNKWLEKKRRKKKKGKTVYIKQRIKKYKELSIKKKSRFNI